MSYRNRSIVLALLFIAAFLLALPTLAQDSTPVPSAGPEPAAVDTAVTTTTTLTPVEDIGLTLNWALAFLALWQAAGIAYAVTVEKTIKPVLYSMVDTFTENTTVRSALLIVAVFAGAFTAVQSGGINLFADVPFGLFTDASPAFLLVLNAAFVASGAFIGHELWQTLESWLKKAKAVADVIRQPHNAQRVALP